MVKESRTTGAPETPGPAEIKRLRQTVYGHYKKHGRTLPWRLMDNPYCILISEIMLQQTQVARVLEKYDLFFARFPDFQSLAAASLTDILRLWQGMGYNRRALALKTIAQRVMAEHGGVLPSSPEALARLPGIGMPTACAICAFAFNAPVVFVETNIRAVFMNTFFRGRERVSDREILPFVAATLDRRNPRAWYNALMDYGAMLKRTGAAANNGAAAFRRQPPFKGSERQVRGAIVRLLVERPRRSAEEIALLLGHDRERVQGNLIRLASEGLVAEADGLYSLP